MSDIAQAVLVNARTGLTALLGWAFEEVDRVADEHLHQFGEPHPAQPYLDSVYTEEVRMWAAGTNPVTGNQAFVWATPDGHEVMCQLVWSIEEPPGEPITP